MQKGAPNSGRKLLERLIAKWALIRGRVSNAGSVGSIFFLQISNASSGHPKKI